MIIIIIITIIIIIIMSSIITIIITIIMIILPSPLAVRRPKPAFPYRSPALTVQRRVEQSRVE